MNDFHGCANDFHFSYHSFNDFLMKIIMTYQHHHHHNNLSFKQRIVTHELKNNTSVEETSVGTSLIALLI